MFPYLAGKVNDENLEVMTGGELAIDKLGPWRVFTGERDEYRPETRSVYLTVDTQTGIHPEALYAAAHEVSHAMQHDQNPVLMWIRMTRPFRWFLPLVWWMEWDASRQAYKMMSGRLTMEGYERVNKFRIKTLSSYF